MELWYATCFSKRNRSKRNVKYLVENLMAAPQSLVTEFPLSEGASLYSSPMGNLLIGCPPEILKTLMVQHAPMPDCIVVPTTTLKFSSSQVCLEFPFYHFLFIQQGLAQGKKLKVLAGKKMCEQLSEMLRVTLLGPNLEEALAVEERLNLPKQLDKKMMEQIIKETSFLALKNQSGQIHQMEDLIEFVPFEKGETVEVYASEFGAAPMSITYKDDDHFIVKGMKEFHCKLSIAHPQEPSYPIKAKNVTAKELTSESQVSVRLLGVSEGFDPKQPANGLLIHFNGKWIMWDCPVYLRHHLDKIGIKFEDLDALFISHVHEDHLDVAQAIQEGKKTPIYTSPEIYHCMLVKLQAVQGCSYEEAAQHFDFHPVYAHQPFDLFGANAEVFYSLHSIPALGLKLHVPGKKKDSKIFISGDNLPKRMTNTLIENNILSKSRIKEIEETHNSLKDFDLVFVDAGGGIIHGDPEDYYDVGCKVEYMHTGKDLTGLPDNHEKVAQGSKFVL